ncbi:MAG: aldehyde dehydrogenase family protein [Candidatus Methanomethylophilaceae archaeon]|nr:aldehyde dehydrogenase family protein [Candidatus Methanomethylophilaceae archaeon]
MVEIPDFQTTEEGRQYEKEIMLVLQGEKKDYPSYFGGLKIASGNEFPVYSPIDESIKFGIFQEPEEGIMVEAVSAAVKALDAWSSTPIDQRADYFDKICKVIKARRSFYAASITVSTGMVREDAYAEVDRLIEVIEKAVEDSKTLGRKRPVGVWAVLSAHNSPFASPVGYAVAAMIAGNTVVMCPSKYCPVPIYMFYELTEKYGLPGGVLNLVVDRKDSSTEELANDMRVMGIAATGSGERLEDLMFLQVDDELKFINEIKGMNPAIVYRPSDMKAAVRDIIDSAFSYSGQRLHSCSKVIITVDDQKKFMEVLSENMKDLRIGDPVDDTSFAGPLISMDAAKRFSEISLENMPFIVAKAAPVIDAPGKNYVAPIVVSGLDDDNDLNFMDSGLPILNIKVVNSIDAAFEEIEDTECGLSAGLFSKDPKVIDRFKKDVDVPLQYINSSSRALPAAHGAELSNFVL